MDDAEALAGALQSLETGVALADAETWAVQFENAKFFQWFAPNGETEATLAARLAGLNVERARARLAEGRPYRFETDVRAGARTVSVAVELRPVRLGEAARLLVECRNITKQKEAEYMLDSYSRLAEKNARELQKEKDRVEKLLLNIMPRTVYEEMKDLGTATPQLYRDVSVLMLDFVGFTEMALARDESALIGELNDIFSAFDRIVEMYGCERIKTIGDGYLAVSGVPDANVDHASNVAKVAVRMRRYLSRRNASHPSQWRCRIGLHTGLVIGSLVGVQKYVYDVFGPAVNLAARLEHVCEPMEIVLSAETYERIREDFVATERGEFEIKGFGRQRLYTLDDEIRTRR